jgi:hypothetical protein
MARRGDTSQWQCRPARNARWFQMLASNIRLQPRHALQFGALSYSLCNVVLALGRGHGWAQRGMLTMQASASARPVREGRAQLRCATKASAKSATPTCCTSQRCGGSARSWHRPRGQHGRCIRGPLAGITCGASAPAPAPRRRCRQRGSTRPRSGRCAFDRYVSWRSFWHPG